MSLLSLLPDLLIDMVGEKIERGQSEGHLGECTWSTKFKERPTQNFYWHTKFNFLLVETRIFNDTKIFRFNYGINCQRGRADAAGSLAAVTRAVLHCSIATLL